MRGFFDLSPTSLTTLAVLLGYLMIDDLTGAEQNSLGNFLILIGQVLKTNGAQQQLLTARENAKRLQILEEKMSKIEQNYKI